MVFFVYKNRTFVLYNKECKSCILGKATLMKKTEPIFELKILGSKKTTDLSLRIPHNWIIFVMAVLILWSQPELWKVIETVKSILGR